MTKSEKMAARDTIDSAANDFKRLLAYSSETELGLQFPADPDVIVAEVSEMVISLLERAPEVQSQRLDRIWPL